MMMMAPSVVIPSAARAQTIGPSTTKEPYLLPSVPGVATFAILTAGDIVGKYRIVGLPGGLGAFRSSQDQFTLLMNHEIAAARPGIRPRARS
jgi:hypothetical protein